jgi:hypothetical protein
MGLEGKSLFVEKVTAERLRLIKTEINENIANQTLNED